MATHHQQSTARQRVAILVDGGTVPGREVVRRLSADGAAVVVHYTEDQAAADALVDEILAGGGNAVTVRADVADELDVERLLTETVRTLGGVDVLVNAPVEPTFGRLVVEATQRLGLSATIVSVAAADQGFDQGMRRASRDGSPFDPGPD